MESSQSAKVSKTRGKGNTSSTTSQELQWMECVVPHDLEMSCQYKVVGGGAVLEEVLNLHQFLFFFLGSSWRAVVVVFEGRE